MILRIRLRRGRPLLRAPVESRRVALGLAALLTPAALMAYVLGFWRLASEIGVAGEFGIRGVFSHWQIWILIAALLQASAYMLNRYGRGGELGVPHGVMFHVFPAADRRHREAPVSRHISEPHISESAAESISEIAPQLLPEQVSELVSDRVSELAPAPVEARAAYAAPRRVAFSHLARPTRQAPGRSRPIAFTRAGAPSRVRAAMSQDLNTEVATARQPRRESL